MPGADGRFSSNAPGAIVAGTASPPNSTGALDRATASRHPHKHRRRCCANPWDRLVNDQALHPSAEVTVADWLGPRLRRFGSAVAGVVPDRFPAYVRILHPARGPDGLPVRWAEVAAWSGRTMHRLAQFHAIRRPGGLSADRPPVLERRGPTGREPAHRVPPAFPLPSRDYLLFAGSLAAAPVLGWTDPYGSFFPQSPTCSGRRTTPGALLPRSTCSAPWSPDRRPSPRFSWVTRALRHGGSNQQTPSPLTATRSTPR
jgi:hypothetical protein